MSRRIATGTVIFVAAFLVCWMVACNQTGTNPTPTPTPNDNANTNDNTNANDNTNDNANANVNDNSSEPAAGGVPEERLRSTDLTYEGAFRLPDDFNWGARGMSFRAAGEGGSDTLLVTGFELVMDEDHYGESCYNESWDCEAWFGEVTIPEPATAANWEDLPVATLSSPMATFDDGLVSTVHREYVWVSDLEYVPQQGTQTSDKLYGAMVVWYAEGVAGSDTFPTIWMSETDGSNARGLFHVGPETTPYHGRKMGSYLFTVPDWYADEYLGGRTLVTGRSRGTPMGGEDPVTIAGGSQGPTLFAFAPWETDSPSGDLNATPMLYYRVAFPGCAGPNVGEPENCDYPNYTMCDEWTGASFVDSGERRAIMLLGYKGLGENCYDEPPVECNDPCSDSHGYHCHPYERQVIFYDVHELGYTAEGGQDPWVVLPYETWRPTEFYLQDNPCYSAGGMTFDATGRRLYMIERGLGEGELNAAVVHVWSM